MERILVIEDNREIAELVTGHLRDAGYGVEQCGDGNAGMTRAATESWGLVILDIMLPGIDGLEICRRLRAQENYVPIMMLTARSTETDRVVGLELGADDYLVKPFGIAELLARVKALLRRAGANERGGDETGILTRGRLSIDPQKRKVTVDGREISLTAREFDLLHFFARRPGRVFSRGDLLDHVWGTGYEGFEHTVNSHINRLRAKIEEDPAHPDFVLTVWGIGYKFNDQTP